MIYGLRRRKNSHSNNIRVILNGFATIYEKT